MVDDLTTLAWHHLNVRLMAMSEAECVALLDRESRGMRRVRWMRRIQSRINRLRSQREIAKFQEETAK